MLLVNFWLFLSFFGYFGLLWDVFVECGLLGVFFLRIVIAWGERSERAKRASEALWCLLWVSLAYPCFRWRTLAFSCVACSTMVCLLSLLSLALPCVTYFNSPKTISLLLLHASTTLICLRASRSLLRQVYYINNEIAVGSLRA